MGTNSKIEWTTHTFNPWRGCTKVSPGCDHCYAERMSRRNQTLLGEWGQDGRRAIASGNYLAQAYRWNRAAAKAEKFVSGLMDGFGENEWCFSCWWQLPGTDGTQREHYVRATASAPEGTPLCFCKPAGPDDDEEPLTAGASGQARSK